MAANIRYFLGTVYERYRDFEYTHTFKFTLEPRRKPMAFLKERAKSWYEGDRTQGDEGEGGWYFHNGTVFVHAGKVKEISEATYQDIADMVA